MPPTQDRPHGMGKQARQMMWMCLSRDWNSPHSLLYVFSPGLRYLPSTTLFYPSASYGWVQACQCKLVITTLRRPDPPIAIEAGLPYEKPVLDLLNEKNLDYPDG